MSVEWQPIRRGAPDVRGEAGPQRLLVYVPLSAEPPYEWRDHFIGLWTEQRNPDDDWPLPRVIGSTIEIQPLDDQLVAWIGLVDERISNANEEYQRHVIPGIQRQEARARDAERKREERLDAARQAVKDL